MSIDRRTIVLGLPALASVMLMGCQTEDGAPDSAPATGMDGHAAAQAVATNVASGLVRISDLYIVRVGDFPSTSTKLAPSSALYQACINDKELHVVFGDSASVSGVGASSRAIVLKLLNPAGWKASTSLSINMNASASNNYGSQGFIYHNPDYTASAPAVSRYAYQMSQGTINVTCNASGQVTLEFSANNDMVKATPVAGGFLANAATGYIYIPLVDSRTVTLNTITELEATA